MFGRKIIAELAEIDENLIRSQFTPAQEASAIFRRKAICEELHPETKRGENWKSDQVAKLAKLVTRVTILAMCGRFTQNLSWAEIHRLADLIGQPRNLAPRFNIAPTTPIEVKGSEFDRAEREWVKVTVWETLSDAGKAKALNRIQALARALERTDELEVPLIRVDNRFFGNNDAEGKRCATCVMSRLRNRGDIRTIAFLDESTRLPQALKSISQKAHCQTHAPIRR